MHGYWIHNKCLLIHAATLLLSKTLRDAVVVKEERGTHNLVGRGVGNIKYIRVVPLLLLSL